MKGGASKVIMGATLVMVVTLAFVLTLILVLLAELYCSLLLRRHRHRNLKQSTAVSTVTDNITTPTTVTISPHSSFYAQGVLHAPRDFHFPAVKDNKLPFLHEEVIELHGIEESNTKAHQIVLLSPTSPSSSFAASPNPVEETSVEAACNGASGSRVEDFVYISNPIYDAGRPEAKMETPFDTPDTSPSRLENCGSSSGDDDDDEKGHFRIYSPLMTPPLSPMKKLPPQACSVSLRDAGSLANSASDSNCNNGISSSSSGSSCTSPSW